ncbi:hypothetical protein HHK36_007338 [Tetracentron sinense]|uniref:Uncharacterized protein n=1 Tax=Tetracentron sinense TaxID=13715 RepID=A0A835DLQ1_TETSI|nr:hypothetical protein HHK36_007338 [Tetracentron sinense]
MHTLNSTSFSSQSFEETELESQNSELRSPSPIASRLWRPSAQRNLRNQWSNLASYKQQWVSASSSGMSQATSLVNAFLSQRNMPLMDLGVLSDMIDIKKKACKKLAQQHEVHRSKLLSSYNDLVAVVTHMINTINSMRCFLKGPTSSPLVQFSCNSDDKNDGGDGGGIPVFMSWSIPYLEKYAQELVEMFTLELSVKRLLVVNLLSLHSDGIRWVDELYEGEFDHLSICNLYSVESCEPIPPRIQGWKSDAPITVPSNYQPDHNVLQVYLTTWLTEVNIDTWRLMGVVPPSLGALRIFDEVGSEFTHLFAEVLDVENNTPLLPLAPSLQIVAPLPLMTEEHNQNHLVSVPDRLELGDDRKNAVKLIYTILRVIPGHLKTSIRKFNRSDMIEQITLALLI